jgi:branched-chain amino acid transport system permease protein
MSTAQYSVLERVVLIGVALLLLVLPWILSLALLVSVNALVIMGILALSMALVWGAAGIFSFGQSVFFGIGAYVYAVASFNMDGTAVPLLLGIGSATLSASILGYFLFYGRISHMYLAVITLTLSLLLFQLINSLSGPQARIGEISLGGYNGIPGVPSLSIPGIPDSELGYQSMYLVCTFVLIATYAGLRILLVTAFGKTVIAIRENETRAELLGYDSRAYKLATFSIGAAIAGLAGVLYAAWSNFVSPDLFDLAFAGQIIIWAMAGGVGTLAGPVVGCFAIQALTFWLGTKQLADTNIVLGSIFMLSVLFLPSGILPGLRSRIVRDRR